MSSAEQAHEPTMEEILASIRRIIADDNGSGEKAQGASEPDESGEVAAGPEAAAAADEDIFADAGEQATPEEGELGTPVAAGGEDDMAKATQPEAPVEEEFDVAGTEAAAEDSDVFELTEELAVAPEAAAGDAPEAAADEEPAAPKAETEVVFQDPQLEEEEAARAAAQAAAEPREAAPSSLVSSEAGASVASAFQSLENFVLSTQSRTLEDLVSEMLRPMLKAWLDANLPVVVERLVREEIERVSRGRR